MFHEHSLDYTKDNKEHIVYVYRNASNIYEHMFCLLYFFIPFLCFIICLEFSLFYFQQQFQQNIKLSITSKCPSSDHVSCQATAPGPV